MNINRNHYPLPQFTYICSYQIQCNFILNWALKSFKKVYTKDRTKTSRDSPQLGSVALPQLPLNFIFKDSRFLCMSVLLACVPAKVRTLDPLEMEFWMVGAATWALGTDFLQQVSFHAEP